MTPRQTGPVFPKERQDEPPAVSQRFSVNYENDTRSLVTGTAILQDDSFMSRAIRAQRQRSAAAASNRSLSVEAVARSVTTAPSFVMKGMKLPISKEAVFLVSCSRSRMREHFQTARILQP